ncbi:MAG: class I SAM-dependent methyltransferase [Candidatus Heimdallarchaeaceae archaeon]
MSKMEKKFVNSKKHGQRNIDLYERLSQKIDFTGVKDVLEIGCGAGILANHLNKEHELNVTGIDLDSEQIEQAKEYQEKKENLQFMVADATKLSFSEEGLYDLAISTHVMHHIGNWEEAFMEIKRVVRTKGFYIFYDMTYSKLLVKIFRPIVKNYGVYTAQDIKVFLEKNNFKVLYEEKRKHGIFKNHIFVFQKN